MIYGVLCASASDSRWHEMGHRTAFRTRWLNDVVYQVASFLMLREPTVWRWSHTRHHSDTIVVGCDPEIVTGRPPDIPTLLINLFNLKNLVLALKKLYIHAAGRLTESEDSFIPETECWKVYRTARIWLVILAAVIALALAVGSILPLMYIGLPVVYGGSLGLVLAVTQHLGLKEDVSDFRLNTRTIYLNPLLRFLYLNMNYQVEHHMFPMVPYYNLPKLHEKLKADMPPAYGGLIEVYSEIIPALLRQRKEPGYSIERQLPPTARPYVQPQLLETMSPTE
ncbi:MAG: fatty acid desaturase [Hyphomicrobiales bacterium]|nr:fatty acid desaturase [Hyphomicrobiales bacterium]